MNWFTPLPASLGATFDDLVSHYDKLMAPKPGRKPHKAITEIQRQRMQKLKQIDILRLEATALFALERRLMLQL